MHRRVVVTVDTEEEGLWGGSYRPRGNTTENLRGLPRFQSACQDLGIAPTYLIDAAVLGDEAAVDDLKTWQAAGTCEVGAHCHPWCNPPLLDRPSTKQESYLCNLSPAIQQQKLEWLTESIAESIGRRPKSYRAGRYGFSATSAKILDDLGYRVDSSVLPVYNYRDQGGPDFSDAARDPYRYFQEPTRTLIEVPVTVGFMRPGFERQRKLWQALRKSPWRNVKLPGVADRLGLARRIKFSPEGTQLRDLTSLIDACAADGLTCLVLMLHSSSLVSGLSPYADSELALDALYSRFSNSLEYAMTEHGYEPVTLADSALVFSGVAGEMKSNGSSV